MRWQRTMTLVEAHCEGETGRVLTGGAPAIPGATMAAKMAHINGPGADLRRFCVFEPRGHAAMSTNLLTPPCVPGADAGFIVMQPDRAHAMSGSNAICVATVLLETGAVAMNEPESTVVLDTPAGVVTATARCAAGKCESVTLSMPPSFAATLDAKVTVPGLGEVTVDVAFGGLFYALVDAKPLGLRIVPEQARALVDAGSAIQRACKAQLKPHHPRDPALDYIGYVMFTDTNAAGEWVGATVMPPGRLDRSPCGTGNSARLAARHAREPVREGEEFIARSALGGRFRVRALGEREVDGRMMIMPQVTGRAWIHGLHQIGLDPDDPYPLGFCLSDTWGDALDLLD